MNWGSAAVRRLPTTVLALFLVDAAVGAVAFYLAVALRFGFDWGLVAQSVGPLPLRALTFTGCLLVGLLSMGLYRPRQRPTRSETAVRAFLGAGVGSFCSIVLFYLVPVVSFGRGGLALAMIISALLVFAVRLGTLRILDFNPIKRRVLVVGAGEAAAKIRRLRRRSDRRRFDVVGFIAVTAEERRIAVELDIEPLLTPEEARATRRLDEIVVALDDRRGYLPLEFLLHQKQRGVPVSDVMDFLERETERLDLDILRPSWLLYEKSSQTDIPYRWLKRLFDLVFSSVLLLLTSPALVLTTLAILIEEGHKAPVFYRQRRVGRHGRVFDLMKFRSMGVDAEEGSGPRFASTNDVRVTRIGRLIRRFRIDELPQLLNVIRGDMSVVGPRPERPEFVDVLSRQVPLYFYRHGVRPGLTGWAQLNFPYGASMDDAREKLTYDLYYIKNTNIVTDLLILLQTLEVVVWGRGTSMSGGARLKPMEAGAEPPSLGVVESRKQDAA
ncbi:MAG: TIGR03013 family XrtA/PEP-CTERM system glycosyltransferase [Gammaproteobacteria bacterium]